MPVLGFSSRISRLNIVRYDKNADYKITFNLKLTSKEFEDIMEEAESSYKARSAEDANAISRSQEARDEESLYFFINPTFSFIFSILDDLFLVFLVKSTFFSVLIMFEFAKLISLTRLEFLMKSKKEFLDLQLMIFRCMFT